MPAPSDGAVPPLRDPADGSWRDAVDRLADADRLVLMLDFDGTLSEIRDDPDAVEIRPDARDALDALIDAPRTDVAVVSGRALADVRERVGIDGVAYAGNHGLEIDAGDEEYVHPDAEDAVPVLERAVATLRDRLADVDGAFVEDKGVTATVHYRQVDDPAAVERVQDAAAEVVADRDELRVTEGKQIRELRPAVDWDKGRAVERILDELDAEVGAHAMYVGDDVTDEAALRALPADGTGIYVGDDPGDTAADYRLPDPAAVADLLAVLADARTDD